MQGLIPHFISRQYRANHTQGQFKAAAIFTDLSGFTNLTESLMQYDKEGAELLTEVINKVFSPLIAEVHARGGLIAGFAGDAFTALFPTRRRQAPRQALQTTFFISQFLAEYGLIQTKYRDFELGVKIGLALGAVRWGLLGQEDQLTYFFRGQAIDACAQAESQAETGDIIATDRFMARVKGQVEAVPLQTPHFFKLTACLSDLPATEPQPQALAGDDLRPFVPAEIIDLPGSAEFRDVCSIFISFDAPKQVRGLDNFVSAVMALAALYGGYFNRVSFGDKGAVILILFGAPVSYENNIERAADFLLALQAQQSPVSWRAGLTFGSAYAGLVGSNRRSEYTAMGDAVNLSARLMTTAAWDEIWCNAAIYQSLKQAYQFKSLGPRRFKGKQAEIDVYRLRDKKEHLATAFHPSRMIGREAELASLSRTVQPIFEGKFAGLIYIYGEAGIGKSRLVHEFRQQLAGQRAVAWFHCPAEDILQQSLNPFKHFLRGYFRQRLEATEAENKASFNEVLDSLLARLPAHHPEAEDIGAELERTRSLLGVLVNLYWPNSLHEQLEPRLRFENSLMAFKNLVKAESLLQPVIIELEDAHWLDGDSNELVNVLTRNIAAYPLALLCTARYSDDGSKSKLPVGSGLPQSEIDLNYFSGSQTKACAEQVLQGQVTAQVVRFLVEKTNGNPFFIEQLALDLRERGLLSQSRRQGQTHYALSSLPSENVPTNINAVLISRLDRLPAPVKQVVQTAAVLGREFELPVLARMLPGEPQLKRYIKQARDERIWSDLSERQYMFQHALLRDSAYAMQLRATLRERHQLAARAFEGLYAADLSRYYADLAYHYEQAEITAKAITYLEKAGDYAKENYQNEAALSSYDRLLNYSLTKATQSAIYGKKGEIFNLVNRWDAAINMLNEGLAGAIADKDLLRETELRIILGDVLRRKGDYDLALSHLEAARNISQQTRDNKGLGKTLSIMAGAYLYKMEPERTLALNQEALVIAEQIGDQHGIAIATTGIGTGYSMQHNHRQALPYFLRAIPMFEELGDRGGLIYPLFNTAEAYFALGDYQHALAYFQRTVAECEEIGDREGVWFSYHYLGQIYLALGEGERAVSYCQESLHWRAEMGSSGIPVDTIPYLAKSYAALGRYKEALQAALLYLTQVEQGGQDVEYGQAHLAVGLVLARLQAEGQIGAPVPEAGSIPPPLGELMAEISQLTGLGPTPSAYFACAIEAAGQEDNQYLFTLIPALYRSGQYLYRLGGRPEAAVQQLAEAKKLASAHNMAGEIRQIEQICTELGLEFEAI